MNLQITIAIPMNDVYSGNFVSMLDKHFRRDFDNSYKWCPGAASRPRMVEIGMVWQNKNTKKVNWIT